jgi:hypothetical protein
MEIGKSYLIKFNNNNAKNTFVGKYVGNNIYNQETFKINDKCFHSDCPFFKNVKVASEIIKDEPLYKDSCICQFVCLQNQNFIISEIEKKLVSE